MDKRIINTLTQAFAGATVELEPMPNGRYSGMLIWGGFNGEESDVRHRRVRQALIAALDGDAAKVGILLTYTPTEIAAMEDA